MNNGSYALASAGFYLFRKLDLLNNNLANVNTPGYKQDRVTVAEQKFEEMLASQFASSSPYAALDFQRYGGSRIDGEQVDLSAGPVQHTGRSLDVAIANPREFFVVQTPNGIMLTRAGNFEIDSDGDLATPTGFKVLGDGGFINSQGATEISITPSGKVVGLVNGQQTELGTLQVVRVQGKVTKIGSNLFSAESGFEQVDRVKLIPSSLEQSNVELVPTMIQLISTGKQFELYTKILKTFEEMNQSTINGGR